MHLDFQAIVETNQDRVRNTCFRFVNNLEDAEDIAQEVFVQVYESFSHFREEAELSTWIYRIAVNKSLDFLRKSKRKKRFGQMVSLFGFGEEEEEIRIPSSSNPQRELEDDERKQILYMIIRKLPENQQTALTLSKLEGFNNKEVSKIMEMSLSAVEALMFRAKKNLEKKLRSYFEKEKT
ncbi:MAG: RNA polymerase sigma factor [Melioribacteraceae bacterium]|nr:RNA polymerase sigma factor [Melioribacteraceae bacterium]